MVKNALKQSTNKSQESVTKNAAQVGFLLVFSRLLGLVREIVISRFVDRTYQDLQAISDKFPSIIRRLSGEGILDYAYIPPLSSFDRETESKQANEWIRSITQMFVTLVLLLIYIAVMTMGIWAPNLLANYSNESIKIFGDFFVMQVPMCIFYFLSSTFITILIRCEVFRHSHVGQPIANMFKIAVLVIGYKISESYVIVGLSALAGAVAHIIWQYYGTRKVSRQKFSRRIFPDRLAAFLVWTIAALFVALAIIYCYENIFPSYSIRATSIAILVSSIALSISVFLMRKRAGDGSLHYGSLTSSSATIWRKFYTFSHIGIISLALVSKISFCSDYIPTFDIVSGALLMLLLLSNSFISKQTYILQRKNNIMKNNILFYCGNFIGITGVFVPSIRPVFIALFLLSNLIQMYVNNFVSQDIPERIRKINENFMKTFSNAIFGVGINQIVSMVSMVVAAQIGKGAPSFIGRADRLTQVPMNLIAVPFGLALLPRMSALIKSGDKKEAQRIYNKVILTNIVLSVLAMIGFFLLSEPLSKLFLGGKTSSEDVSVIRFLFKAELLALPAWVLSKVLSSIFFATNNSKTLFHAAALQCSVNVPLKILAWKMGLGVQAFPIASIAGAWTNAIFLMLQKNDFIDIFEPIKNLFAGKTDSKPIPQPDLNEIEKEDTLNSEDEDRKL